jgi:hypothetical protein
LAAREARFGLQACQATRLPVSLIHEPRTGPALTFHRRQGGVCLPPLCSFLDRHVNLAEPPVEVGDRVGCHLDPGDQGRVLRFEPGHSRAALADIAVTSLAASIATAIPITDSGAPGNSVTMPCTEN